MVSTNLQLPEFYEKTIIVQFLWNERLRDKYIMTLYPAFFLRAPNKFLFYLMQELYKKEMPITIESLSLLCLSPSESVLIFLRKTFKLRDNDMRLRQYLPTTEDLLEYFGKVENDVEDDMFTYIYNTFLSNVFNRIVEESIDAMNYNKDFNDSYTIESYHSAKRIVAYYNKLYAKRDKIRDQLEETKKQINSPEEYIPTAISQLNSRIGGFTRGYVSSIIAKSSHCKSSFADFNMLYCIYNKYVEGVLKITPEETAETQWRRIIATLCHLPLSGMRQKLIEITDDHIKAVKKVLNGKLIIVDDANKMQEVIDTMEQSKADMVIVDHINSIDYPGTGNSMTRMIGGIPGLVNEQKRIAKQKRQVVINLSQVNDKDIMRSDRVSKEPRYWDAYGSSVLFQAAREYIALWYPYKDYQDSLFQTGTQPSVNDLQISIEKSSFSGIGKFMVNYDPEYNVFTDKKGLTNSNGQTKKRAEQSNAIVYDSTLF